MQIINSFTNEVNQFVDRFGKVDGSSKKISNVLLSAARIATFMASAGCAIMAAAALFAGSASGFFNGALFAVLFHDGYQLWKNCDQKANNIFHGNATDNTIIFKPVVKILNNLVEAFS